MTRQDLIDLLVIERFGAPVTRERRAQPTPVDQPIRVLTDLDRARNRRVLCEAFDNDPGELEAAAS